MIYISLLVHENINVILNQLHNFNKFYSKCTIVIHISKTSKITINTLEKVIKSNNINNVLVNKKQADTSWGNIISGHIANIELIKNINGNGIIVFHASNDMIISKDVENYVLKTKSAFNKRLVLPDSYWWPAHMVLQDKSFTNFINSFGSGAIFASQIEGSFYETDILFEIIGLIKKHDVLDHSLHYTKEEIFFSTIAYHLGYQANNLPYIFSEVHDFDRILWNNYKKIDSNILINSFLKNKLKDYLNKKIFKQGNYKISKNTIYAILNKNNRFLEKKEYLDDGNNIWKIYDKNHLYGVKRVERKLSDPIRIMISKL